MKVYSEVLEKLQTHCVYPPQKKLCFDVGSNFTLTVWSKILIMSSSHIIVLKLSVKILIITIKFSIYSMKKPTQSSKSNRVEYLSRFSANFLWINKYNRCMMED